MSNIRSLADARARKRENRLEVDLFLLSKGDYVFLRSGERRQACSVVHAAYSGKVSITYDDGTVSEYQRDGRVQKEFVTPGDIVATRSAWPGSRDREESFREIEERNKKNEERMRNDRLGHNRSVLRSYRIKNHQS